MTDQKNQPEESSDDEQVATPSATPSGQAVSRSAPTGNRSPFGNRLLEGIIVGVTAGLVLAGVNFGYDSQRERRQLGYINEIFSNSYAVLCAKDREEENYSYKLFYYFMSMLQTLDLVISHRSDRISSDKLYDLRLLVEAAQDIEYRNDFSMEEVNRLFYFNSRATVPWINTPAKCS